VNIIRKGSDAKDFDAVTAFTTGVEKAKLAKTEEEVARKAKLEGASEGFEVTDSGLRYLITQTNPSGTSPEAKDMVSVHYTGYLLDGTKFDSLWIEINL